MVKPNRIALQLILAMWAMARPRPSNICTFLSVVVRSVLDMSVRPEDQVTEPPQIDPLTGRLADILDMLAGAVVDDNETTDAVRIDRLALLERLQAVTAALQAAESVKFAQSQVAEQFAADVHPDAIGRGIAEQIALACRISPVMAARRLNTARALWFELPDTCGQLSAGELSERVAEVVVTETRHLDPDARREVDRQLAAAGISKLGFKAAASCARKTSYEADREGYLQRGRTRRKYRRVGIRPAPDTMAVLTGYLPVEQGARRPRTRDRRDQQGTQMVATALHRTEQSVRSPRPDCRRRYQSALLRRLAGQAHQIAGPDVQGSVL